MAGASGLHQIFNGRVKPMNGEAAGIAARPF